MLDPGRRFTEGPVMCPVVAQPLQSLPVVRMQVRMGVQGESLQEGASGLFLEREPDQARHPVAYPWARPAMHARLWQLPAWPASQAFSRSTAAGRMY